MMLPGLMQDEPLLISNLIRYAATYHGDVEIVTRTPEGPIHRYTYAKAHDRAAQVANLMTRLGVQPGERIGTLAWTTHRHFDLFYGVSGMGAVLHTVNPRLFEEQISYIINHAEDRFMFLDADFVPLMERISKLCPTIEGYVILTDRAHMPATQLPNVFCYEELIAAESADFIWPRFDERQASSLCYTSGTTGNPKGVLYSHRSTVIHAMAAAQNSAFGLSAYDVIMPIAPMYHAAAWSLPYIAPMVGAKLVLPGPGMDGKSIHELIEGEAVSFCCAVPTVFSTLFDYLEKTGKKVESLARVMIGGSAVPKAMTEKFLHTYGVTVLQIWGMTETSPLGTIASPTPRVDALPAAERAHVLDRTGRVQFGLEIKIIGEDGRQVPRDGVAYGDMWVRGPWVSKGYFRGEGGNVLDQDGWFPTGDVATMDAYGYIKLTDRSKDVIKSGGEWISSIDLENLVVGHPKVGRAAVIGVFHPKWEERPLMVVVPAEGTAPTEKEILDYLAPHVAKWWLPDAVVFVDEIPLTATGKYKKIALRETFKDYLVNRAGQAKQ